ncbi:hypothetical protein U27_05822 [Candidatus Vecturithrix granuli]|uniref:Uncharacterized protein n=1 Tax=Vecturithrix granuli TaxID=1499967 RepID=A0A081C2P2_VECG1|nr:hypothetical protein U27_05822 [Candidatus Vecturithrix granuli]
MLKFKRNVEQWLSATFLIHHFISIDIFYRSYHEHALTRQNENEGE